MLKLSYFWGTLVNTFQHTAVAEQQIATTQQMKENSRRQKQVRKKIEKSIMHERAIAREIHQGKPALYLCN